MATVSYNLWATEGFMSTPDGNSIYIRGLSPSADGAAQLPGPLLVVRQGDEVQITLTNRLPVPVALRFPGQPAVQVEESPGTWGPVTPVVEGGFLVSLTNTAPPGGTVVYRFTAAQPGTYLYESGTAPHVQTPLGMYGALVVRPADFDQTANRTAYGAGTGTDYDREFLVLVSEIDPEQHLAIQSGRPWHPSGYLPRYWTMNGRCAPDTMLADRVPHLPAQPYGAMIMGEPGERILIRYANAGLAGHPLHPHGNHARVVAVDGRLLRSGATDSSHLRFTVLVAPGQTYDTLFQWTGLGHTPENPIPTLLPGVRNLAMGDPGWTMWSGTPYLGVKGELPVGIVSYNGHGEYHFMVHSHEEPQITNWGEFPGGLMTMIAIHPPGMLGPDVGVLA